MFRVRLQVPDDELTVAVLRRQRVHEPDTVTRKLRSLNRFPGIVDVVRNGFLDGGRPLMGIRTDRAQTEKNKNRDGAHLTKLSHESPP